MTGALARLGRIGIIGLLGGLAGCDVVAPLLDSTPPRLVLIAPNDTVWPDSSLPVAGRAIDNDRITSINASGVLFALGLGVRP